MRVDAIAACGLLWVMACSLACGGPGGDFRAPDLTPCQQNTVVTQQVIVTSYNIRATLSSSIEEIGDVLEATAADIIVLQEVDRRASRSGDIDQAAALAQRLGMDYAYNPAHAQDGGDMGVAILSRLPFARTEPVVLDTSGGWSPRVAIDAWLCAGREPLRVIGAHADVMPWASRAQSEQLAQLAESSVDWGVIVAGDLNSWPDSEALAHLTQIGLTDVVAVHAEGATFQGDLAPRRLDYLLLDAPLAEWVEQVWIPQSPASDHRPVAARLATRGLQFVD